MNEAKYPSKERVERDGVLVHAVGDDLVNDPDEAKRQGYKLDGSDGATVTVTERVERDGVLIAAEGDEIPADQAEELGLKKSQTAPAPAPDADAAAEPAVTKAPARRVSAKSK